MTFKLVLFISFVYIAYVSAQEQKSAYKQCKEEFPDDRKSRGMCVLQKRKVVENGKLSRENFDEWSTRFFGAEIMEQYRSQVDDMFNKCKDAGNDTEDVAEKTHKIASCVYDEGQKIESVDL